MKDENLVKNEPLNKSFSFEKMPSSEQEVKNENTNKGNSKSLALLGKSSITGGANLFKKMKEQQNQTNYDNK